MISNRDFALIVVSGVVTCLLGYAFVVVAAIFGASA